MSSTLIVAGPSTANPTAAATATAPANRLKDPGSGHLHLSPSGTSRAGTTRPKARFTTLLASYPLKLLTPTALPSQPPNLAVAYTLAYGGGLVAGDTISLSVVIGEGCGLVMLTQGSTKVFKRRAGIRPLSHSHIRPPISANDGEAPTTRQRMAVTLASGAFLLLLPDSISPFASSKYAQAQRFLLPEDGTGSVLILDWVNSGRGQRPRAPPASPSAPDSKDKNSNSQLEAEAEAEAEIWSMDRYASTNEIFVGDRLVMRERMVLDNDNLNPTFLPSKTKAPTHDRGSKLSNTARQLAPYNIYATALILGPHLVPLIAYLKSLCDGIRQFQIPKPPGLIWSFSEVEDGRGGVLRLAAVEVEDARVWLRAILKNGGVDQLVGDGLWPRVI